MVQFFGGKGAQQRRLRDGLPQQLVQAHGPQPSGKQAVDQERTGHLLVMSQRSLVMSQRSAFETSRRLRFKLRF